MSKHTVEPGRIYRAPYHPSRPQVWRYTIRIDGDLSHSASGYATAREARDMQAIAVHGLIEALRVAALAAANEAAWVQREANDRAMFDLSCEGY